MSAGASVQRIPDRTKIGRKCFANTQCEVLRLQISVKLSEILLLIRNYLRRMFVVGGFRGIFFGVVLARKRFGASAVASERSEH